MTTSRRMLFIGDSITDASRLTDSAGRLGTGFVRRIHEMTDERGLNATVMNRGIGGDRLRDLRNRWTRDCLDLRPDVLTILIGINDVWRHHASGDFTPSQTFTDDYDAIVRSAQDSGTSKVVLMEPFLVPSDPSQVAWAIELDEKVAIVQQVASRWGCTLVDLRRTFLSVAAQPGVSELVVDGIHPTANGHQLIAEQWWVYFGDSLMLE